MMALPDGLPSVEATVAGPSCFAMLAALFGMVRKAAKATLVDDLQLARSVRSHIANPDLEFVSICRAFNLSRSRLYRVMSSSYDIASETRHRRWAGTHRDIASPESIDVLIGLIAQRWRSPSPRWPPHPNQRWADSSRFITRFSIKSLIMIR